MGARNILQVGPVTERFNTRLTQAYQAERLWTQADREAFLSQHGADVEVLVTSIRFGCDATLLERLPNLRAICNFGVGYDSVDVGAAKQRGIQVSNTPDVLNDCVADLALGLIIDTARRLSEADRFVRRGAWSQGNFPLARRVTGKRVGIVGLGRIGKDVAKRCAGFDMQIRYHNRKPDPHSPYGYEAELTALARWADFLVLTCPGGAQTRHLVDAPVLEALGPQGLLINVARGSVVDEVALVAALQNDTLGGAGLDVFEDEPRVPAALLALDNVVLLPHIASGTEETRLQMEELVFSNLDAFLADGQVLTAV